MGQSTLPGLGVGVFLLVLLHLAYRCTLSSMGKMSTCHTHVNTHTYTCALPDIGLCAAWTCELVFHEIGIVRGGHKVVTERLSHVLVNFAVEGVEYIPIIGEQVHQETILGHCITPLGCRINTQKLQTENPTPPWCAIIFTMLLSRGSQR